jgi:hypothetical protein
VTHLVLFGVVVVAVWHFFETKNLFIEKSKVRKNLFLVRLLYDDKNHRLKYNPMIYVLLP